MIQVFCSELLEQLAGASIRSLCLAALVIVLIYILRMRAAPLRHALWTVVLISMLFLPLAGAVLSVLDSRLPQIRVTVMRLPLRAIEFTSPGVPRFHRTDPLNIEVQSNTLMPMPEMMPAHLDRARRLWLQQSEIHAGTPPSRRERRAIYNADRCGRRALIEASMLRQGYRRRRVIIEIHPVIV